MKWIFFPFIILFCCSEALTAQLNGSKSAAHIDINIGPELGIVADANNFFYFMIIGGSAEAEMKFGERFAGTLMSGVNVYIGKKIYDFRAGNIIVIPLKAGIKYYIKPSWYLGENAGVGFFNSEMKAKFGYSSSLGHKFMLRGMPAFDISLKADVYSGNGGSITSVGIRGAYQF